MTHKTNPKIVRAKKLKDWESRWFEKKNFKKILEEDFKIREFFERREKEFGIEKIEIERFPGKINVIISTCRPGLLIGRRGRGIEEIKRKLSEIILKKREKRELNVEIKEVRDMWSSATLVAQWVAQQLEKRAGYRRTLKQAISKIKSSKEIKGAKIEVSGRLDGVEIARKEWLKFGKLPRQTVRADIDYGTAKAFCTYGVIGVKVWIYKGEKFD